ncbi:uncharacterized protein LOC116349465 [Contarinia nasturtii]|uniref:uncharacterized protein LOC116349465 n=1 Tax=Contarinia nasturtii TaxID=265458 RepID=UPI0012D376E2|nr:uncharacterized protein LOC116349465 [Contarinia nasturtii]
MGSSQADVMLENLIVQIVLPRYFPPERSPNFVAEELELMKRMLQNVESLSDYVPINTVEMLRCLADVHLKLDPTIIRNKINFLQPGETFAMFVRAQNCGLLIHMLPEAPADSEDIIVATFPAKVHPREVYNNPSDLEFNYPSEAIKVKNSNILRSKEFADMLLYLYENKLVDSHIRDYVSKWLATLLMNESSSLNVTPSNFPVIKKKIRDEILETNTEYVRRSSFYMCVKVMLQHSLTCQLGEASGKLLYKIIMLKFITDQCDHFNQPWQKELNVELVAQVLAKLARRVEKLPTIGKCELFFTELKDRIKLQACSVIHETRLKIDKSIENLQIADEKRSKLSPLVDLNFEADVIQRVSKLHRYLKDRSMGFMQNGHNDTINVKTYKRYYTDQGDPIERLKYEKRTIDEVENNLFISDFENYVLYKINVNQSNLQPNTLRASCKAYIEYSETFYKNDPLGYSKMILVSLKIIAILDKIATTTYPLLLEHSSGINPKIVNYLLLPKCIDMQIAYELEIYFLRRNKVATYPSLIEETQVTERSFSAKFGGKDPQMRNFLSKIKFIDDHNIIRKQQEWLEGREKVENLRIETVDHLHEYNIVIHHEKKHNLKCELCIIMKKIEKRKKMHENVHDLKVEAAKLSHQFNTIDYEVEKHSYQCTLCYLNRQIKKTKIDVYERLLPEKSYEQNAVVFELNIPDGVACLRDTLYAFIKCVTGRSGNYINSLVDWKDHRFDDLLNNNMQNNDITIGSSTQTPNVKLHVDEDFERFVVHNGFNCIYHSSKKEMITEFTDSLIKNRCTLSVENDSKYKYLQWAVRGTSHTMNEVLARQANCVQDLSIAEFKNFGSLRADGNRLQWRKLYAMIESEALSFENSSVLSLVMQSIWEMGVGGDVGAIRESHEDLKCINFSGAIIRLLEKYIEQQKNNWAHPLKLLMIALIAVRVFEINENEEFAIKIATLLNKLRMIAMDWMEKSQKAIQDIQSPDQSNQNELRMKLVFVAIAGACTFNVHPEHTHFYKIFAGNLANGCTALRMWLQFIVTLNNSIILKQQQNEQNLRMLLRLVRNIGINIEPTLRILIKQNLNDVYSFVQKMWSRSKRGQFIDFDFDLDCRQILKIKVIVNSVIKNVTIDIITGELLVNNFPICRLPDVIIQSKLFKSVFEKFVFEVQPDTENCFASIHKYNGHRYEFMQTINGPIIIEQQENGTEMELLPPETLTGDITPLLIEKYSHWFNKRDKKIEFRPKLFSNRNFSTEIKYELDLKTNRLIHKQTNRMMLDITSNSYRNIVRQLDRLEQPKYIHVLMDEPKIAKIELVRMQLKFKVDCTIHRPKGYDLLSNEFSSMRVSLNQKCGTLYGLENGLLLEAAEKSLLRTKLLLLPHGKVRASRLGSHVTVNIDVDLKLRTPPWHSYQVDDVCRQLKPTSGTTSAWFYLAYLHAVTSHGQMEPFMKMSGTERALQILQSNYVWSSGPYDQETIQMLHEFERLTPRRRINAGMLSVAWPLFIQPHSAQDSYIFIVKKLLSDSERLKGLYSDDNSEIKNNHLIADTNLELNIRNYLRYLPLKPNLRISHEYIAEFTEGEESNTSLPIISDTNFSPNTQTVAILCNNHQYYVPTDLKASLKKFLITDHSQLPGANHIENVVNILSNIQQLRNNPTMLREQWISFYEVARSSTLLNVKQFALIWTLLAHHENNIDAILALQAVATNRYAFKDINSPDAKIFFLDEGTYSETDISTILYNFHERPIKYRGGVWSAEKRKEYDDIIENNILCLKETITEKWPCPSFPLFDYPHYTHDINIVKASEKINSLLSKWYYNHQLDRFIDQVVEKLNSLPASTFICCPKIHSNTKLPAKNWSRYKIDWTAKLSQTLDCHKKLIDEARIIWESGQNDSTKSAAEWWTIYNQIVSKNSQHLVDGDIFPRSIPTKILPKLISNEIDHRLKWLIGAWAISIASEQRFNRISTYWQQSQQEPTLEREIDNTPYENWKPSDYPEWLLFEIEQNLTIRRIQIEIARRMIDDSPSDKNFKHFTMQFNMGEGKTAVVVPILASILANGQQACQITVLKSLFATNLKSLRQYLGGMLNRRIYVFPCRRDLPINKYVTQIHNMYKECMQNKGVILTLPEYRLSFQLKIYESVAKHDLESAQRFLDVHQWINENVRNILDESDAILHAKYQLIYTVGNQRSIDGGSQRWFVIQALLKRIPSLMSAIYHERGEKYVEFNVNYVRNGNVYGAGKVNYRNDVFTPSRILDETMFAVLKKALIEDFLSGKTEITFPEITASAKNRLRILLGEREIDKKTFEGTLRDLDATERKTVLILSGLLRFEVLKLILTKRWRVNYGVNEKGSRKMAIPFKAKDVAAECTEFGHPDVAICLTQLSYYYSGLSDEQLMQTFQILAKTRNAPAIYSKWIGSIDPLLIDPTIQSYFGINLIDTFQRDKILFPLFRFNMHIIDFWLSNVVFLHEAKSFERKLMCNAWDLTSEHMKHSVRGFSGTNDTKDILPLPVTQNDLSELENTNESVRQTLLQPENQKYENLPSNVSAKEILKNLVASKIPVLVDSGALMLELNNKQVAIEWLKLVSDPVYEAAIYFDEKDVLQTIDRNAVVTELDCSVYRDNLDRCLVYLDDSHTRGTDLKFPLDWKACVTLSGDITRDKTVQACMRMRQLGKRHSIAFWASFEADLRIRDICKLSPQDQVTNENVVEFIRDNSRKFEVENTVHWVSAAHNYTKKLAAHKLYEKSTEELAMRNMYKKCVDKEFVTLKEMYGDREDALLSDISKSNFEKLSKMYEDHQRVVRFIQKIDNGVTEKLSKLNTTIKRFAHSLDEEQEKELELEHEVEEFQQIERPPKVDPCNPIFDGRLIHLVRDGLVPQIFKDLKSTKTLLPLSSVLSGTKIFKAYKNVKSPWVNYLYATKDFSRVIKGSKTMYDEFLRPVWWIAHICDDHGDAYILVLLSCNEVNRLLPYFRQSSRSTLFMFRPQLSKLHSDLLRESDLRVTGADNHFVNMNVRDIAQIKMFSGCMYFNDEQEQNAYCNFLGLIPRPRSSEQEIAFENGFIRPNGFVPLEHRQHSKIAKSVNRCKFKTNPIDLAIKLIEAHHDILHKESHVAAILERGVKLIGQ